VLLISKTGTDSGSAGAAGQFRKCYLPPTSILPPFKKTS